MKRIAILVKTSLASGRGIISGISKYIAKNNNWHTFQHVGRLETNAPEAIRNWQSDGIIAQIKNPKLLDFI